MADLSTQYDDSLKTLRARVHEVPPGWTRAYLDALRRLSAVRCAGRSTTRLIGPFLGDVSLTVLHAGNDRAIEGILRRLQEVTACTCEICGRVGKLRAARGTKVMCARCAAPWLLRYELQNLLNAIALAQRTGESKVLSYEQLPFQLRPVLPRFVWHKFKSSGSGPDNWCTSYADLIRIRARLQAVDQALQQREPTEEQ